MKFLTRLRFDENGMKDLSGTSWENVGVVFDTPGKFGGRAARFDGMAYLETTNDEFDFGSDIDFTISLWMKYSNAKDFRHQVLFGSYLRGALDYRYCSLYSSIYSNCIPACHYSDATNDREIVRGNVTCDDNIWHHLAVARSGNSVRMFVDGKLTSIDTSGVKMDFAISGTTTMIGWLDVRINDTYYYVGELDDICVIKDRALWTADFVPPSNYLSLVSCLYMSDGVYGMK